MSSNFKGIKKIIERMEREGFILLKCKLIQNSPPVIIKSILLIGETLKQFI